MRWLKESAVGTAIFFLGLVLLFVGERLIGVGTGRGVLSIPGLVLLAGGVAHRVARWLSAPKDRKRVERWILALDLLGVFAVVVYFAQSDLVNAWLGKGLDVLTPRLFGVLGAIWPVAVLLCVVPLILVELAYRTLVRAPEIESGRVADALFTGLGFGAALIFAFCCVYVAAHFDHTWDLSTFHTARPGQSTRKLVGQLTKPVDVALFFPPANQVHEQVDDYFTLLKGSAPKMLRVHEYDRDLDPAKARELGVTGNGAIVVSQGTMRRQLLVSTHLAQARNDLERLDQEVLKRLMQVTRGPRKVYFTSGHGERSNERAGTTDRRGEINALQKLIRDQNASTPRLGLAEGLSRAVPKDASAVAIIGPTQPFSSSEIASLVRYVKGGGRLLIALDPSTGVDYGPLLAPLGLSWGKGVLADDRVFIQHTFQIVDRTNLVTASFSSHPSVTTLSQLGSRAPVVMLAAGHLGLLPKPPKNVNASFTVYSRAETWSDLDGNDEFDSKTEKRKAWPLAAAVTVGSGKTPGRAVVLADSDALTDQVLRNRGNAYLALDATRWLLGDEAISGTVEKQVDPIIVHTRGQDAAWFYTTIFLAPALVLAAGFGINRRKKRAR